MALTRRVHLQNVLCAAGSSASCSSSTLVSWPSNFQLISQLFSVTLPTLPVCDGSLLLNRDVWDQSSALVGTWSRESEMFVAAVLTANVELVFSCLTSCSSSSRCFAVELHPCTAAVRGYCGRRVLDSPCRRSGGHCGGSCGDSRENQATADRGGMFADAGTRAIYATTGVESGTELAEVVADSTVARRADRGG